MQLSSALPPFTMAAAKPDNFNALLEESYVVISDEDREAAELKHRYAQTWITRCINKCAKARDHIKNMCPEGDQANWNMQVVRDQCKTLELDRQALQRQLERYMVWSDALVEIHSDQALKDAQQATLATETARVEEENTKVLQCLAEYQVSTPAAPPAAAPAAATSATPTVKVEKELKPDRQLDLSDTARDYERWLEQYSVYHARSNFAYAKPAEQRQFLSRCMTDALWRRATAAESPAEADLPLDTTNLKSGIFYHLLGCFSASDPLLGKRANIFSEKLGRQKHTGQGKYESYPVFISRLHQRLYECEFDNMSIAQVKQALIVHFVSDPGLLTKIMEATNPTPDVQHMICMKYADTQQKTSAVESTLSTASVNATRMGRTCARCNANHTGPKSLCKPCFTDIKKPVDKRTRIKNFTCSTCQYTGHHVTAACNETNKKMVYIEKGEKANKPPAAQRPQANPKPRGGRGPTQFSGKAKFNPKGTANAVHTTEQRVFEDISDSASEDDDTRSFATAVSRAYDNDETHYATNSVRVTLTNTRLSSGTTGIFYRVDGPHAIRVTSEQHWRLKRIARNRRTNASSHNRGRGSHRRFDEHWSLPALIWRLLTGLISTTLFVTRSLMGRTFFRTTPQPPTVLINTVRVTPAYKNLSVSRVAPGLNQNLPQQQALFCPELDNMNVVMGNTLAEKRRHNRVRTTISACPDTGSARSICSPALATRLGARIHGKEKLNIIAANGSGMRNSGTATLRVTFEDSTLDIDFLLSPDIDDRCLIGLPDLKRFRVVPKNFPCILPENI